MPFQTKITRARFVLGPFTSEDMENIGGVLLESVSTRIRKALNVNDTPAKALKPGRNGRRGSTPGPTASARRPATSARL